MANAILLYFICLQVGTGEVDSKFVQVHPVQKTPTVFVRSADQGRAVVLLHGIRLHPFSNTKVNHAEFQSWQESDSKLVQALGKDSDVYAFAYGQPLAVEAVAAAVDLPAQIGRLKEMGYTEIVLVGHSAGGLIARYFVEDHPRAGVTKVIQVCSPNGGSSLGKLKFSVRKNQEAFLESLTPEGRQKVLEKRAGRTIPERIEFLCVVGSRVGNGDGVVSCDCQWTADLQEQGIPVCLFPTDHLSVMRSKDHVENLAELVRKKHPRWDEKTVEVARNLLLGNTPVEEARPRR